MLVDALLLTHAARLRCGLAKLGYMIGYWGAGRPRPACPTRFAAAERLKASTVLDRGGLRIRRFTPLAGGARATQRIKLGTSICQLSARTPTAMAMAALTPTISRWSFRCLGSARQTPGRGGLVRRRLPQAARPHARVRRHRAPGAGARGAGRVPRRALPAPESTRDRAGEAEVDRPSVAARPPDLPAAEGPKNVALAAEIADGWLPMFYAAPDGFYRDALGRRVCAHRCAPQARRVRGRVSRADHRRRRRGGRRQLLPAGASPSTSVAWGPRGQLPQQRARSDGLPTRRSTSRISTSRARRTKAAAAVPLQLVEDVALVGPKEKIRDDLERWRESTVTTMIVSGRSGAARDDRRP